MSVIRKFKDLIKRLLRKMGYDLRPLNIRDIFSIRQTMEEALEQIKTTGFYPDLVIDVGVANGTLPLQKSFPGSFFYWIEPLVEFEEDLKLLSKKYKGDFCIAAAGAKEEVSVININEDLHGSSLLEQGEAHVSKIVKREITVTTINALSKKNNFQRFKKILMKLDVQGFELDVLEGASDIMENVEVIVMEVGLFKHYKSAPDFYDIIFEMKKKGYVIYDIVEGLNRPYDYALSYKDLIFVKENGIFRHTHQWK